MQTISIKYAHFNEKIISLAAILTHKNFFCRDFYLWDKSAKRQAERSNIRKLNKRKSELLPLSATING